MKIAFCIAVSVQKLVESHAKQTAQGHAKAVPSLMILSGATLHKMEEYVPILVGKRTSNRIPQNNAFQEASRRYPKPAKAQSRPKKLTVLSGATLHKMEEYVPILLGKRTWNRIP